MKRRSKRYEHPTLFISGNIAHRIPLFTLCPKTNENFLANLNFYRRKYEFLLHGYVLMPDHYHLLLTLKPGTSLADLLRDFKSYVGRQVVDCLTESSRTDLLERLRLTSRPRRRKDARHQILQHDNDIVEIFTPRIFRGKLQYMHDNPVKKGLVGEPGDWKYSSWSAYERSEESLFRVDKIDALSQ